MQYIVKVFLFLSLCTPTLSFAELPVAPFVRLVGIILDDQDPLNKSILVIKDTRLNKTYTVTGQNLIPGTNFSLRELGRQFIIVTDGETLFRIDPIAREKSSIESFVEENRLDQLDSEAIIARTNLAWERLEERAKEQSLEIFRKPEAIQSGCDDDDCEEEFTEDDEEYPPEETDDEEDNGWISPEEYE